MEIAWGAVILGTIGWICTLIWPAKSDKPTKIDIHNN